MQNNLVNYNSKTSCMLRQYLLLSLLGLACLSVREGWLLSKAIPTSLQATRLLPSGDSLLVQTTQGIHAAPFSDPNAVLEEVVVRQKQTVPLAVSAHNHSYLYMSYRYINYQENNSGFFKTIPQMKRPSNLVQFQDSIFFYTPEHSGHLLAYDLHSDKFYEGPFLSDHPTGMTVMEINRQKRLLFVSNDGCLFVVDLASMTSRQLTNDSYIISSITNTPSGRFLTVSSLASKTSQIYRLDGKTGDYVLIYTLSNGYNSLVRNGFTIHEDEDRCKLISFNAVNKMQNLVDFDCGSPYDRIVDKLGTDFHLLGDDQRSVYSIVQEKSPFLVKHDISAAGFSRVWARPLHFTPQQIPEKLEILKISSKEVLLFRNRNLGFLYVWSKEHQKCMCEQEIKRNILVRSAIKQLFFNPTESVIYLLIDGLEEFLSWINLQDCSVSFKKYDNEIVTAWFMKERMFIKFEKEGPSVYEINEETKEMGKDFQIDFSSYQILNDTFYGIQFKDTKYTLNLYDDNFQMKIQTQIECNMDAISLSSGPEHISVGCSNFIHLFNPFDLEYLGSTSLRLLEFEDGEMEETFSSSLRFHTRTGELHGSEFRPWENALLQIGMLRPCTDLYFYNQTCAFFISMLEGSYYLSHAVINGFDIMVQHYTNLNLNYSQIILAENPMKFSCSKQQIIVQYIEIFDNFVTYINVYEAFTFRFLYSHRVSPGSSVSSVFENSQLFGEIDCSGTMLVSGEGGVKVVQLSRRRTISETHVQHVSQLVFGSNGRDVAVFGFSSKGSIQIEVWDIDDVEKKYIHMMNNVSIDSKILLLSPTIYILDSGKLYENLQLALDSVSDCTYFGSQSILCLRFDGSLSLIPPRESLPEPQLPRGSLYTSLVLSPLEDVLVSYGPTAMGIYSVSAQGLQASQTIGFKYKVDLVAIASDSSSIITYSQQQRSFFLWQKGACPPRFALQDGLCQCADSMVYSGGECLCPSGQIELGDDCAQCSFYCSECAASIGHCTNLSTAGVLLIVILVMVLVIIGVLLLRCLRRRKGEFKKKQEEVVLRSVSQLTDEYTSIND